MNKILQIIQRVDKSAFDRWDADRHTMFANRNYVQFKAKKLGVVKINYDQDNETYVVEVAGNKINDLYYDQVIDTIDALVA